MKDWKKLIISILVCEGVGISGTPFTLSAIPTWYVGLEKPFFSPPNWIFGPVWTILYLLMGISFYLLWVRGFKKKAVRYASVLFGIQLLLNLLWTPLFFGLRSPLLGLIDIVLLLVVLIFTITKIYTISKTAAYLLIPYLLWVSFATMLNAAILILN